jgi:hypothetical protein
VSVHVCVPSVSLPSIVWFTGMARRTETDLIQCILCAGSGRTVAAIAYYDELTAKDMETIKEILNIARRVANSVDSSTAAFEPDASATREVPCYNAQHA